MNKLSVYSLQFLLQIHLTDTELHLLDKRDPGEDVDPVHDLVPVDVAAPEEPVPLLAPGDGVSLPPVHHPEVVEHRQVPVRELVLDAELLVGDSIEQFESSVNFSCRPVTGEGLGAPHLIVEVYLLDILLPVQFNCRSAEPLVESSAC